MYDKDDIKEMVNYLLFDNARGKEDMDVICIVGLLRFFTTIIR